MVTNQSRFVTDHLGLLDAQSIKVHPLIYQHLSWLADQNTRHNLTAVPQEKWMTRHVLDSIAPLLAGWNMGTSLLDLGTGAGFPGMPIALQSNLPSFVLLDSKRKITQELNGFLNKACLSLRGMAVSERAEVLGHQEGFRESYDRVVVRAVDTLPVLIELGVPLLVPDGELWCWKSDLKEVITAQEALDQLAARVRKVLSYRLPEEDSDRFIVSIGRVGEVPTKYPRHEGIPHKRPIRKTFHSQTHR